MSALSVLDALDRQIGNNYNAAPSYEQLQEARAAVAELIEAGREAARSLSAAATALEVCKGFVPADEWNRLFLDNLSRQLQRNAAESRAALARVGGAA